jgi:hypothetical protein
MKIKDALDELEMAKSKDLMRYQALKNKATQDVSNVKKDIDKAGGKII